jgi:hypothetical protein
MKTTYVLIDHENVQPKDLALLNGQPGRVILMNRCSDAPGVLRVCTVRFR